MRATDGSTVFVIQVSGISSFFFLIIYLPDIIALYTQHLLDSQSLEFEICIFPREAIPSQFIYPFVDCASVFQRLLILLVDITLIIPILN